MACPIGFEPMTSILEIEIFPTKLRTCKKYPVYDTYLYTDTKEDTGYKIPL